MWWGCWCHVVHLPGWRYLLLVVLLVVGLCSTPACLEVPAHLWCLWWSAAAQGAARWQKLGWRLGGAGLGLGLCSGCGGNCCGGPGWRFLSWRAGLPAQPLSWHAQCHLHCRDGGACHNSVAVAGCMRLLFLTFALRSLHWLHACLGLSAACSACCGVGGMGLAACRGVHAESPAAPSVLAG